MKNLVQKPTSEEKGARRLILRVLNARVSLPTWMIALSSAGLTWAAGILFFFTAEGLGEFGEALPFNGVAWLPLVFIGTHMVLWGLARIRSIRILRYGSFISFVMWFMAGISFLITGNVISAIIIILPWLLFYAYLYLASHFRDETGL